MLILVTILAALFALRAHRQRQHALLMGHCIQFYESFSNGDMATAYRFMSPRYKQNHSLEDFGKDPGFADLESEHPHASLSLFGNGASLYRDEVGTFDLYLGYVHYWTRSDGRWYFTGEYDHFLD